MINGMDGQTDSILGMDSEDKASLSGGVRVTSYTFYRCHMINGQSIVHSYSLAVSASC